MSLVRGQLVRFIAWRDRDGREEKLPKGNAPLTGTLLDAGPERGEWWVLPHGERHAVVVKTGRGGGML